MTDEMEGGPRVPSELGEYQPVERLGSGGMGEVWLASKDGLIKPRALKILRPELAQDQEYRRRFFREAEIGAGLRHCRIVSVYDFGEAQGHLYLVMDFIDGVDLATLCRAVEEGGEQLPYEAMGYVIGEVFEALHYAHTRTVADQSHGVIHRDVTPRNVMISSSGEVFLTDFGIARYETDASGEHETFGTLEYMAPEQARGQACFESDIYGAAGVLHFMLTGEAPRRVARARDFLASLSAPPPATGRRDVPEPLERLRVVGLEPEVGRRIATANDALTVIDRWRGYRRATRILAQLYRRYIGKPRSGMSGLLAAAKARRKAEGQTCSAAMAQSEPAPPTESSRMTVKVSRDHDAREEEPGDRGAKDEDVGRGVDSEAVTQRKAPVGPEPVPRTARQHDGAEAEPLEDDEDDAWNRPWWRDAGEEDEESIEEEETVPFLPDRREADAPRLRRRSRRSPSDPSADVAHLPAISMTK